jgi:membrane-bound metal-dependent hydrolase YbcI (DUF457 family)
LLQRRFGPASLAVALGALVLGLDLTWELLGFSTGSLAFGLVDEPAHLATAGLCLLALGGVLDGRLPASFVCAALAASVAIDADHIPGYLGWDGLAGGVARPYPHGLLLVLALLGSGFALRGRYRHVLFGLSFGVAAHLLRDSATGPGISPAWPFDGRTLAIPYLAYAAALLAALLVVAPRPVPRFHGRRGAVPANARRAASAVAIAAAIALAAGALWTPVADGSPAADRTPKVAVGAYVPGVDEDPAVLDAYAAAVGRPPAIAHLYRTWSKLPFEPDSLNAIWARGAVPLVTWEPWGQFQGAGVSLWEIASGGWDAYIAQAARQAVVWSGPLLVRFAHEMNGGWYPWGASVNGNTPAVYRSAWRRVVSIFRSEGADNVRWVWTPYADLGKLPFKRYYPGDKWVDWAGLDGFNWGYPFMSFRKIFDSSYEALARLTSKPLMIAETGSVEEGGNKAAWVRRAMRVLPRYTHIKALVWFSDIHPDGTDWRVDSSPSALNAFRQALRVPEYTARREFLFRKPGWLTER